MKKFFFIFYILIQSSLAEVKIETIAIVNQSVITNIDLENEKALIIFLNKNSDIANINKYSLNSLIDHLLKKEEILKNQINIDKKFLDKNYRDISNQLNLNSNLHIKNKVLEKIKTDIEWNTLVSNKYSWKININMEEIEEKLKNNFKDLETSKIILEKEKLINEEKNKKLQIYSLNYFNNIKKNSFIKIYK